jgi:NAD+ kinase
LRINILVNTHREDATLAAKAACEFLLGQGIDVGADRDSAEVIHARALPLEQVADAQLVITFGGDGTLIRAAHVCSAVGTPILGVYYGRFGFVTQCKPNEIGAALSQFFAGKSRIEDRMMVQTELIRAGQVVATMHSLNEAVLQRAATTRLLTFEVTVDGERLTRYPADGVMVATPTGSTAYNLSAGGPVVDPRMQALILTAITPHTLSARSLILRPDSSVRLSMETRGDAVLSCDGQSRLHMLSGDEVKITRSPRTTRLVSVDDNDFLAKLAERLLWSQPLDSDDDEPG